MIFSWLVSRFGGYYGLYSFYHSKKKNKFFSILCKWILKGYQHECGCFLPFTTIWRGAPNFIHGTYGVFISANAEIGCNVTIYQNVTIGSNMLFESKHFGSPKIGDNCILSVGCAIIGNISIGVNCRVAANVAVNETIPSNSIVFPSKVTIIQKETLENKVYINTPQGWGYKQNGITVLEKDSNVIKWLVQRDPNDPGLQ